MNECPSCSLCEKPLKWMDAYLLGRALILCEKCWGNIIEAEAAAEKAGFHP